MPGWWWRPRSTRRYDGGDVVLRGDDPVLRRTKEEGSDWKLVSALQRRIQPVPKVGVYVARRTVGSVFHGHPVCKLVLLENMSAREPDLGLLTFEQMHREVVAVLWLHAREPLLVHADCLHQDVWRR
jgi:hypothetical protein